MLGEINKNGGADGYATYQMSGTHYGYTYETWAKTNNIDTATKAFMAVFERPNMNVAHTDRRCNSAKKYYDKYHGKMLSGGMYEADGKNGIICRFTSSITGRTFTVYDQNDSNINLGGQCNRATAASIASGYRGEKTEMQVIDDVHNGGSCILSNATSTKKFFDNYGLKMAINDYSYSVENIRKLVSQGKYIAIWFNGSSYGKSGSQYSSRIHWIGIIGYRNEEGKEQIFISNPISSWGNGWKDIDEFETCKSNIQYFNTVYESK